MICDPNAMDMRHLFGFIPVMVNGWHLYFHLVTGLACIGLAVAQRSVVVAGFGIGAIYIVTGAAGLISNGDVYGFIMADTFGNWVHVVEGVGLVATGLVARRWLPREAMA